MSAEGRLIVMEEAATMIRTMGPKPAATPRFRYSAGDGQDCSRPQSDYGK